MATVNGIANLKRFIDALAVRRVDIAGIGDSNQIPRGGHNLGSEFALKSRFGLYASGVGPMKTTGGPVCSLFGVMGGLGNDTNWSHTAAPAELDQYKASFRDRPYAYLLLDGCTYFDGYQFWGCGGGAGDQSDGVVAQGNTYYNNHHINLHLRCGTFPSGTGGFSPQLTDLTTYTINSADPRNPVTGAYGLSDFVFDMPATPTGSISLVGLLGRGLAGIHTPFFGLSQRHELVGVTTGAAYTTLLYQGGQPTRVALTQMQSVTQTQMTEEFYAQTFLQGVAQSNAMLMVDILQGGNDRNDTNPSWDATSGTFSGAAGNTATGVLNNMRGLVDQIVAYWTGAGYARNNLFFLIRPAGHPQATFPQLADYESALLELTSTRQNVCILRNTQLIDPATIAANGWYNSGGTDTAHLTNAGYIGIDDLAWTALMDAYNAIPAFSDDAGFDAGFGF